MESFNIDQDIDELKNTVNEFLETALTFSKDNVNEYNDILVSKKDNSSYVGFYFENQCHFYFRMIFNTPKV